MAAQPTVTLDLENHRTDPTGERRYLTNTERLLDFLDDQHIRATIFVVGDLAGETRKLLTRATQLGHEIALHAIDHTPLEYENRSNFGQRLADSRRQVEDTIGARVRGFRAPLFSLTEHTRWVTEILPEAGFSYSSSVLPASNPLYGYPAAPRTPFRWSSSLVELPVPVARFGTMVLPFLGGIYLRYLPMAWIRARTADLDRDVMPWIYLHPYDIDADEDYVRFAGTSVAMSLLLWRRRRKTLHRLETLVHHAGGAGPPLGERVDALPESLPLFL